MKKLDATKGFVILLDDEDFERLSAYSWYAHSGSASNGRVNYRPAQRESTGARKVRFLAHHIMPPIKGYVIDHINGDPWDNRRCNLRYCTNAENVRNRRKHGGSCRNPFKGVYRNKGASRFFSRIMVNGKAISLGGFTSAEDAARAYDAAALRYHGRFARLNFPHEIAA